MLTQERQELVVEPLQVTQETSHVKQELFGVRYFVLTQELQEVTVPAVQVTQDASQNLQIKCVESKYWPSKHC